MTDPIPAPQPISTQERQFIASVEDSLRPAFLDAIVHDLGPSGRPAAELSSQLAAAAPGERLQRVVEATMNSSRHFDRVPADDRTATAGRAALAIATQVDARLTVEAGDGRLGRLAGRAAGRVLRGEYETVAHEAGNEARLAMSGAITRAHFQELADVQRHAGAGVVSPTSRPTAESANESTTAAAQPPATRAARSQAQGAARD
ncbi:hypothetical protein ACQPYH_17105 [Kribbella sp. CA-245084]|uniref:hypothetical protein n=1 Tax=Kribbella sp. CA-245084 TaxID=3239940 RepID=UPI003D94F2A1